MISATCRQMPVEVYWVVSKVKRAHAPLRCAYNIIRSETQDSTDDDAVLQMAIKALNDTVGPDGLIPTLLVFRVYPRINFDSPLLPDITVRAYAIQKAMRMLCTERVKANINYAISTRNRPTSHEVLNLLL